MNSFLITSGHLCEHCGPIDRAPHTCINGEGSRGEGRTTLQLLPALSCGNTVITYLAQWFLLNLQPCTAMAASSGGMVNSGAPATLALPVMSCRAVGGDCKGIGIRSYSRRDPNDCGESIFGGGGGKADTGAGGCGSYQ